MVWNQSHIIRREEHRLDQRDRKRCWRLPVSRSLDRACIVQHEDKEENYRLKDVVVRLFCVLKHFSGVEMVTKFKF